MDKITVMIVDDHPLMRNALRKLLENQVDIEVIAERKPRINLSFSHYTIDSANFQE